MPHKKLLGIHLVSTRNPATKNQRILMPAHSNGWKLKWPDLFEIMKKSKQKRSRVRKPTSEKLLVRLLSQLRTVTPFNCIFFLSFCVQKPDWVIRIQKRQVFFLRVCFLILFQLSFSFYFQLLPGFRDQPQSSVFISQPLLRTLALFECYFLMHYCAHMSTCIFPLLFHSHCLKRRLSSW